jgi:glycerol kinase
MPGGRARFGTVDTWLLHRLSAGAAYATDYTNACRTLLFNIDKLEWDRTLLGKLGLARLRLPECHPSAHSFAQTDLEGLLPHPVPLTAMVGDSHASAFGQGCFEPGSAKITMGTGCSVLMNTGRSRSRSSHGMMATLCWSTPERTDYALEGIIVSCGATLTWLRDQIRLYRETSELDQACRRATSSNGVYLVPAFSGLGAPHWRMDAAGSIQGLTFAAGRDHILRAALESIAFQVKDVLDAMAADAGVTSAGVVADGGISANAFVMQLAADLLGVTVTQRGIEEVSALGAACLAGLGNGLYGSLADLSALETRPVVYGPGLGREAALSIYKGWQAAVART